MLLPRFRPRAAAKRARDREIHDGTNDFSLEPLANSEFSNETRVEMQSTSAELRLVNWGQNEVSIEEADVFTGCLNFPTSERENYYH